MKKNIKAALSILLVIALISVCGCAPKSEYVKDLRNDNYKNEEDKNNTVSPVKGTSLDPFEGLIVEFDGISPFCTISFNNSRCSEDVQLNVEYSVEPYDIVTTEKYFKINEEVTVYATLKNQNVDEPEYYLTSTVKEYKVENVPEYITEITDNMDLSQLKSEINDYLDSITAFTVGNDAMGIKQYDSHTSPLLESIDFSVLKLNSYNKFNSQYDYFNKINLFYGTTIFESNPYDYKDDGYNKYFSIVAKNIVRYPDGTIGWGKDDPNSLSFEYNIDSNNMESLINANITSIKTDYNVTEITNILQ